MLLTAALSFRMAYSALALLLAATSALSLPSAWAGPSATVTPQELTDAVNEGRQHVPELRTIQELARKMGVRVWLFGGTASAFAHYCRGALLSQGGEARLQPQRFNYEFGNIFRSTQDIDLIVDGSAEDAERLENAIRQELGSGTAWEVRPLRVARGAKRAILDNPDFTDQHNDSGSTGLIELTDPPKDEPRVRDIRTWETRKEAPPFLEDAAAGRISYVYSERHAATGMYQEGSNPPIFSAIRYLAKAFQYDLEIPSESLARIRKIVRDFHPEKDPLQWSPWAKGWLEERGNGAKLFKHALDVERAWNTLEELGLRKKLIALSSPDKNGSLGWWMSKEPLRSSPVGRGEGKTLRTWLKEQEIDPQTFVVSHETSDYAAYESMTRNTSGLPNAFVSREGAEGERALYGEGHYVSLGPNGAGQGTGGFLLRYKPRLDARLGSDFEADGGHLLFKNRNALEVIPDSIRFNPIDFFKKALTFRSKWGIETDPKWNAIEQMARRLPSIVRDLPEAHEKELAKLMQNAAARYWDTSLNTKEVLRIWFSLPISARYPEIADTIWKLPVADNMTARGEFVELVLSQPVWAHRRDWLERAWARATRRGGDHHDETLGDYLIREAFSKPHWSAPWIY